MKVTILDNSPSKEEIEIIREERGNIPEMSKEDLKKKMVGVSEIKLSQQVVDFASDKLGMTPDEFVAMILNDIGASH